MKLKKLELNKLCIAIQKLTEFKATDFSKSEDVEYDESSEYLTYHAVKLFDTIIVCSEYSSPHTDITCYFVYDFNKNKLRECTEDEDTLLRECDMNDYPFRELEDCAWIISKSLDNKVKKWSDKDDK